MTSLLSPSQPLSPKSPSRLQRFYGRMLQRWLAQMPASSDHTRLTHRQVIIVPTRAGMLFLAVLVAMLITCVHYSLNLGFLLTALLGGVGWVCMLQTWRNVTGLELRIDPVEGGFAGRLRTLNVQLMNPDRRDRYALHCIAYLAHRSNSQSTTTTTDSAPISPPPATPCDVTSRGTAAMAILWVDPEIGQHPVPILRTESTYPLGLWRARAYWRPGGTYWTYPAPEEGRVPSPPMSAGAAPGRDEDEDLAGVREGTSSDAKSKIAWKAMAKSDQGWIAKAFEPRHYAGDHLLDWQSLRSLPPMQRIARLSRWVVDAESAHVRYALRLPGRTHAGEHGPQHFHQCLQSLTRLALQRSSDEAL